MRMGDVYKSGGLEIRAAADDELVITIYDVIGRTWDDEGVRAKSVADELNKHKGVKRITVNINSPGGSVFDSVAIYNILTRHKARVTVNVDGMALSGASIVAMAGDEICMAANALMMIHDPWDVVLGSADEMRAAADTLDKVKETLVNTYAGRATVDAAEISDLMTAETWFTADEAVEIGLADEVTEAKKIAAMGDLSRFKNVPGWLAAAQSPIPNPQSPIERVSTAAATVAASHRETGMSNESNDAETAVEEVKVATVAEMKAAFPDSDAEFREGCQEANCTIEMARQRWAEHVQTQNKQLTEHGAESAEKIKKLEGELAQAKADSEALVDLPEGGEAVEAAAGAGAGPVGDDEQLKAEYRASSELQAEFGKMGGVDAYVSFAKATARGAVRIAG